MSFSNIPDTPVKDASPSVLIVDDNPFNRELLKKILARESLAVDEARNGEEAIEKVAGGTYRLIFMDLLMPRMGGMETIQRIRQTGVTTPIIIVTSMSGREDRQRCMEAGGNEFMTKPLDARKILELVRHYVRQGPAEETEAVPETFAFDFNGLRILLIEEEAALTRRLTRFMEQLHMRVTHVSNGDKAWEMIHETGECFDMIISNVFTSGIDGLGILARIKRDYDNVMVFIYAEEADPDTFQLALQLGADGVLTAGDFEHRIIPLIESAIYRHGRGGTCAYTDSTARQVRKAQKHLVRFGCSTPCDDIDVFHLPRTDAGGDMAACRRFDDGSRCGVVLGDVSGHTVLTSYISAIFLGIMMSAWEKRDDPLELLKAVNLEIHNAHYEDFHLCATAVLWDRNRGTLQIASAGNPGALLVRQTGDGGVSVQEQVGGGMCLGLLREERLFLQDRVAMQPGDLLFLFTDGIQARTLRSVLTGGTVNLQRESIRGLCREITDEILKIDGQQDDVLLVALRDPRLPEGKGIRYSIRSSYQAVDSACRWAERILVPDHIPPGRDDCFIMLALREALLNAVSHGNRFNPDARVTLSLNFAPDALTATVSDEGDGFELPDHLPQIEEVDVKQSGGRGLATMRSVADEIRADRGVVQLVFREQQSEE